MPYSAKQAFTLIELSIVLIVIGLVIGGVLVGRDLIFAAQVRQQIAQIESFDSATNTFKLKYGAIPGDISNAVALGLGTAGGAGDNGNGNGQLDTSGMVLESHRFWHHLGRSGLINGRYDEPPLPPVNYFGPMPGKETPPLKLPMVGVDGFGASANRNNLGGVLVTVRDMYKNTMNIAFKNAWILATSSYQTEDIGGYPGFYSQAIDQKADDGFPTSGNILAAENISPGLCTSSNCHFFLGYGPTTSATSDPDACVNDTVSPLRYTSNTKSNSFSCAMLIKANF